jgi:hypothetical protein
MTSLPGKILLATDGSEVAAEAAGELAGAPAPSCTSCMWRDFVPASTGAAIATTKALPEVRRRFDGVAVRGTVAVGSVSDLVFLLGRETTAEEVNPPCERRPRPSVTGRSSASSPKVRSSPAASWGSAGVGGPARHDPRGRRRSGEGDVLVRQRVGLHQPDSPASITGTRLEGGACRCSDIVRIARLLPPSPYPGAPHSPP